MRKWFDDKKSAITARDALRSRTGYSEARVFKKKWGKNKGRFYVGTELEFINLNS
jgi:hypothetical protein